MLRLKESLRRNQMVRVFSVGHLCHPKIVEMVGLLGGFDAVWIDQEHCGLTIEQIENCIRAARAVDLDSFVRVVATDYATVMRPLEAGTGGIMAAQVRNAAETEQIIRWAKFQPRGMRGIHGAGTDGGFGTTRFQDYLQTANANTLIAIQIENQEAVNEVEKIAAVPDVDVLFVGPADLSQSMGIPGQWDHPRLWEGIERVARAAQKNSINWAMLPLSPEVGRRCVGLGCRMLSIGLDVWAMTRGIKSFQQEYAEFFG